MSNKKYKKDVEKQKTNNKTNYVKLSEEEINKKIKSRNNINKNRLYYYLFGAFLIIAVVAIICIMVFSKDLTSVIDVITFITTLTGVVSVYVEYRKNKALSLTNNLITIYSDFNDIETNRQIQYKLEVLKRRDVNLFTNDDITAIRIYLKFFLLFSPMFINNVVSFKKINSILGYRFYLIMNNPYIQDLEIIPNAGSYKGCITMHYLWNQWSKKHNFVRSGDKFSLEKRFNDYYNYIEL